MKFLASFRFVAMVVMALAVGFFGSSAFAVDPVLPVSITAIDLSGYVNSIVAYVATAIAAVVLAVAGFLALRLGINFLRRGLKL